MIDPIELVVPPGATALGAVDDQLLIGTRDLGTARYREGDAHPRDWLRRKQMFQDATGLSVACARAKDCWIATGARQAWHWNGERFVGGRTGSWWCSRSRAIRRDRSTRCIVRRRRRSCHLSRIEGRRGRSCRRSR